MRLVDDDTGRTAGTAAERLGAALAAGELATDEEDARRVEAAARSLPRLDAEEVVAAPAATGRAAASAMISRMRRAPSARSCAMTRPASIVLPRPDLVREDAAALAAAARARR